MRRKLAYILIATSLLVASAAAIAPAIVNMDTDVAYGAGKDLYFQISEKDTTAGGVEDTINNDGYTAVDAVAKEFESRLEGWNVNSEVQKIGYDTIKVTVRAQQGDDAEYSYLERYLGFSGGDISVAAGSTDDTVVEKAPKDDIYNNGSMFKGQTAEITYVNNVPVVTIGVNATGEAGKLQELIKYCGENTSEADSSAGTEAKTCYLVLWSNFAEGDNFNDAYSSDSSSYDSNMAKRLIFGENVGSDGSNAWYQPDNENDKWTRLQLIPNSTALQNGKFDSSKAGAAYKAALYYMSLFNASSYDYDVNFSFSHDISASTDALVNNGDWHQSPALGATLISALVAFGISIIILALIYHLGALAIVSNVMISMLGSILLFGYFGAQFGIGAVVGLILGALVTAFGGIYYFAKFKEEIYSGHGAKKAHLEAAKKALWPNIDALVISVIVGLCVYGFIPGVIGKLGLMLILASAIGTLCNIVLLRIEGWFLANDNKADLTLGKVYGVDEKKVPNLLKEEKQTYFGLFADKNFHKNPRLVGGILSGLTLVAIVGLSVMCALNSDAYNYAGAYNDETSLSLEYRVEDTPNPNALLSTQEQVIKNYLPLVSVGDGNGTYTPVDSTFYSSIVAENSTLFISANSGNEATTYKVYYYQILLSKYYADESSGTTYDFKVGTETYSTLNSAFSAAGDSFDGLTVRVNNIVVEGGTPSLGTTYLSLGIAVLSCAVYMMLRFKLSRGLASGLISLATGLIVAGFFSLTRIPVTPLVNMAVIATSLIAYLFAVQLFSREKEVEKESRERDKSTLQFKSLSILKANTDSAEIMVFFAFLIGAAAIFFFGFGPSAFRYSVFLGIIVGFLVSLYFTLYFLAPLSVYLAQLLSKIHISLKLSRGDKGNDIKKKKTSEPEEAVFIGIND